MFCKIENICKVTIISTRAMTTVTLVRKLRILEMIIICSVAVKLEGKFLLPQLNKLSGNQDDRVKRGYSHNGQNDYGSTAHVSSAVLQYGNNDEHVGSLDSGSHLDVAAISAGHSVNSDTNTAGHFDSISGISHLAASNSNTDPWSNSGISSTYEVWLQPLSSYGISSDIESSSHINGDHIVNTGFSDNAAHYELPSSQLHTQISSSAVDSSISNIHDHGSLAISDNIDFSNVADVKSKHYPKSYGK